ncbi:hypothetical protein B0H66DRAFT_225224 [Apodospora peruviana]|uniref:Rhodopsin domain-containing protein n=1 Tax=Apodospora peruviana TaxID=516989 RepID=A0AAE0I3U2_9PEZI|nr:hypothetical protein B0H66DRAFT_225224 [Apodospora peruviana]
MGSAVEGSPFTPEQLADWTAHDDSLVPNIIACVAVTSFFSVLFVALRLLGRRLPNGTIRLHVSDWLILVSLFFFLVSDIGFAMLTPYGGGRHVIYITDPYKLQVWSLLSEATYGLSMGFMKLSILSLYGSIFVEMPKFRWYLWGVALFIVAWTLTASLGAFLQCVPVARAYDPTVGGYCIHYGQLSLVVGICNVITDFVIVLMPIPIVMNMRMSHRKKITIITIFAAGCSAVIVSIIRLVYSLEVGTIDGSWTAIPAGYTGALELTVGFLVVSIPAYRMLYKRIFNPEDPSTSWSHGLKGNSGGSSGAALNYKRSPYNSNHSAGSASKGGGGSSYWSSRSNKSSHGENDTQTAGSPGHVVTVRVASTDDATPIMPEMRHGINVTDRVELTTFPAGITTNNSSNGSWLRLPENAKEKTGHAHPDAWRAV